MKKITQYISPLIPFFIKCRIGHRKHPEYRENHQKYLELSRLRKIPRFQGGSSFLLGEKLNFVDSASMLFIYEEIFEKNIYEFKTNSAQPYIIDAGANIGLSVIYFKKTYPNSKVVAFEPDETVYDALKFNIESFNYHNEVEIVQKALWDEETVLHFYSDGADAGRLADKGEDSQRIEVPTTRLRPYLNQTVDFLKIDIEGAETTVLEDCADMLHNVLNLFVEYHSFAERPQELHRLLSILQDAGFRYYVSHTGVESPHPFMRKDEYMGMDNQLNVYATRF